ncbi:ArnT family glycosyltransferase [Paraburkholderia acidiphila]|uniref:Glycosyltransferase RgtA/B/C/D-like domain-containing protein n=1 Tax=Paraburkholderia acidiphila TaxID=2571747 RepID=A0A7Z2G391_9BURK|nr:glycosyltransferase family 39 protein [Paraburkholderia acidiphila]QGZ53959.1 hypothetical protein FAZ97_02970 [Paraburkholderia acidiphila]
MANTLAVRQNLRLRIDSTWYVALAWVAFAIVVNPVGNFPLNDDWSYGIAVQRLLQTGQFHPTGWTSMPLITQVLWGSLFCVPFGFSYTTLRISTLVAGFIGIVLLERLVRSHGCDARSSALTAAVLAFNPLYFNLANTFMADVPFTAAVLASVWLFCRYLNTRRGVWLAATLAAVVASLLIRQLALCLPVAMTITLAAERRCVQRKRSAAPLWIAAGSIVACAAILRLFALWLEARGALPATYHAKEMAALQNLLAPHGLFTSIARGVFNALTYLGWFLAPLLVWRAPAVYRRHAGSRAGRTLLAALVLAAVGGTAVLLATHHPMPLGWNIIQPTGVGPHTMRETLVLPPSAFPRAPLVFWQVVTAITLFGAVMLAYELVWITRNIVRRVMRREGSALLSVQVFLLAAVAAYCAPLIIGGFFDRYLLTPLALLAALIAIEDQQEAQAAQPLDAGERLRARAGGGAARRRVDVIAWALLLVTGVFAVSATHDYLAWNRARWQLVDELMAHGVPIGEIDGGLEVNGLYAYDPAYVEKPGKSWYWVNDDRYVVTFAPLPGYHEVGSAEVGGWIPNYRTRVLAMERDGGAPR